MVLSAGGREYRHIYCFDLIKESVVLRDSGCITSIIRTYHEVRGFHGTEDGSIWIFGTEMMFVVSREMKKEFQLVQQRIHERAKVSAMS